MPQVETVRGPIDVAELGPTLMHEHIFVKNPEIEENDPSPEWNEDGAIETAQAGMRDLLQRGIRSMVDLTVLGLGRSIPRIQKVAAGVDFNIVVATGYYTYDQLPTYYHNHGPGLRAGGPDPLHRMFVRDIVEGIAGTGVKAAMIKIATDKLGFTPDVKRVFDAGIRAYKDTGTPLTTHTFAKDKGGKAQQDLFIQEGVDLARTVIGHCGDSTDLDYLRGLMDAGSYIGMDRFGLTSILPDDQRTTTVAQLCALGYAEKMILSHDAGYYSVNGQPTYRAKALPNWTHTHLPDRMIPALRDQGVTEDHLQQMMVTNPMKILGR